MKKSEINNNENYRYEKLNENSNSNTQVNLRTTRKRVEGPNEQHHYHYYPNKKIYRSTRNKWLGGVCGGVAEHFNKSPTLIRLLWILGTIISFGVGVLAYIAFWLIVDKYPAYYALPPRYPEQTNKPSNRRSVHIHYY